MFWDIFIKSFIIIMAIVAIGQVIATISAKKPSQ